MMKLKNKADVFVSECSQLFSIKFSNILTVVKNLPFIGPVECAKDL